MRWCYGVIQVIIINFFLIINVYASQGFKPMMLDNKDKILILAPHPDDEVLGAAGIIQQAQSKGIPVKIVFLTNGDSNPWSFLVYRKHPVIAPRAVKNMGRVRQQEALNAASLLGIDPHHVIFLGYPDFGMMHIWTKHWGKRPAKKGILTRSNQVMYQQAYRKGALYKGEEVLKDLTEIIGSYAPTKIFVSHPSDHNGDHLAFYLFMQVALWDLGIDDTLEVYPYLIHYLGWPKPKGDHPDIPIVPPMELFDRIQWYEYQLTPAQQEVKRAALEHHATQFKSTPRYLLSFVRPNEIYGDIDPVTLRVNQPLPLYHIRHHLFEQDDFVQEQSAHSFVGVQWKITHVEERHLVVSIETSKALAHELEVSLMLFGYRSDIPFAEMPKIHIRISDGSYNIYDQGEKLDQRLIDIVRTREHLKITLPLKVIGNPERLLTSARTYLRNIPIDTASWVRVYLENE